MLPRLAFATGAATAASALAKAALEFRGRPESDVAPPEQLLRVQRAPAFLTPDDIKAVHALRRQHLAANAPHASEVQGEHGTYYLQAAGLARAVAPELLDKLTNLAFQADASHFGGNAASAKIRCVEFHEYGPGAQLQKQTHFDLGSSVTVDCMLSEDGDYEGGNFETLEADGSLLRHTFKQGDVLIFPSLKYHCVSPITSGFRRVMVIELWQGPENECNHRCDDASNSVCENPRRRKPVSENPDRRLRCLSEIRRQPARRRFPPPRRPRDEFLDVNTAPHPGHFRLGEPIRPFQGRSAAAEI